VLCFYFDFSDQAKQTLDAVLRTLAFQVFHSKTGAYNKAHIEDTLKAHHGGRGQPATDRLSGLMRDMLADQTDTIIILDALDESTTRRELIRWIKDIVEQGLARFILTSRPEADFYSLLPLLGKGNCLPLDKAAINADIYAYVASSLKNDDRFTSKRMSAELCEQIRSRVGAGADGM
jgi:hypothetical protein